MTVIWTKAWSSSDDGTVLSGNDIGTIQSDINGYCATFAGTQEFTGNKTFSGNVTLSGNVYSTTTDITTGLAQLGGVDSQLIGYSQFVCYSDAVTCYDDNVVYYP